MRFRQPRIHCRTSDCGVPRPLTFRMRASRKGTGENPFSSAGASLDVVIKASRAAARRRWSRRVSTIRGATVESATTFPLGPCGLIFSSFRYALSNMRDFIVLSLFYVGMNELPRVRRENSSELSASLSFEPPAGNCNHLHSRSKVRFSHAELSTDTVSFRLYEASEQPPRRGNWIGQPPNQWIFSNFAVTS